jgi:hypothetical protein
MDRVTYDEIFLVLTDKNGNSISVGELNDSFKDLLSMIVEKCPGFPGLIYPGPFEDVGIYKTLWSRVF